MTIVFKLSPPVSAKLRSTVALSLPRLIPFQQISKCKYLLGLNNDVDFVLDLQVRKYFKAIILIYSCSPTTNAISKYIYGDIREEKGNYESFKYSF